MIAEFNKEYHWKDVHFLICPFCQVKMEISDLDWLDLLTFCEKDNTYLYFSLNSNNNYSLYEASVRFHATRHFEFNFYEDSAAFISKDKRYDINLKWPQTDMAALSKIYNKYSLLL